MTALTSLFLKPMVARGTGRILNVAITFREELERLKQRLNLTLVHVLVNPPAGWTGERGFISTDILKRHLPQPFANHEYFICGPGVMMDAIEKALGDMNVPLSMYHFERYDFL